MRASVGGGGGAGYVGAAAPKAPAAVGWTAGEEVQIWSASRSAWVDGVVEAYFPEAGIFEGFSVPAGAVKVSLNGGAGVKWIMPDKINEQLKRCAAGPAAASPASPSAAAGGSQPLAEERQSLQGAVQFCKTGCGRTVQTGLARSLKSYDTCCKRCAMTNGKGGHDNNCGGRKPTAQVIRDTGFSPKERLDKLLRDEGELRREADRIFNEKAVGARLAQKEADNALLALFAVLGAERHTTLPKEEAKQSMFKEADRSGAGSLDAGEFRTFCRAVLQDRHSFWFPNNLRVSTANFVGQNMRPLTEVYRLGRKLGEGSFGIVYSATHVVSGESRVCKQLRKVEGAEAAVALAEIGNMAMLDHPNVIKVYEYFDDGDYISQIMEPCHGGELQDKVTEVRSSRRMDKSSWPYDETFIRNVMKQTLRALAFMHSQNVVHKDLKPQNVMLVDKVSDSIKVIDFGLAEILAKKDAKAKRPGGTLLYMAPQCFEKIVSPKVDVWSAGVILYNLLTGDYPFIAPWEPPPRSDPSYHGYVQVWEQETEKVILQKPPNRAHPRLRLASSDCLDIMWNMMNKEERDRPDAETCLLHRWFQDPSAAEDAPTLSVGVMQNVEAFARLPEMKKAIFLLIAHQSSVDALLELRALFTHFDVGNAGVLTAQDLRVTLIRGGMAPLTAERVVHALDLKKKGSVGWTEFMAAAIWVSVSRKPQAIEAAFATFDTERSGRAQVNDFARVFGGKTNPDEWREHLPQMLKGLLAAIEPTDAVSGMKRAMKFMTGYQQEVTKEQFHKYATSEVAFAGGDALFAVS